LDEINSFLGIIKSRGNQGQALSLQKGPTLISLVQEIQENLFTIQAEVAGADKKLGENKVSEMENLIGEIEKELPPIKNFLISGSTEMSALFDFARTLSRRAERRVVAVSEENLVKIDKEALAYLNRLSSLLFALARFFSKEAGVKEDSPKYK
jgi:cob(I)alamin adenosyltransferase